MNMTTFWLALGIAFWAEMGDKTQFIALAYAARYRLRHVVLGILWGIAAMLLLSVGAGRLLGVLIPEAWLQAGSAMSFVAFAAWTLYEPVEDEKVQARSTRHPVWIIGASFVLAELGDKTAFTTMALAATQPWMAVWAGSAVGMALSDGLGIALGRWLGNRLPQRLFKYIAAFTFFAFGVWTAIEAFLSFRR